ncbi:hypothetical protein K1X84_06085 [bacterium]|nr:hypothetical protein [bacterium]
MRNFVWLFVGLLTACGELSNDPLNEPPVILSIQAPAFVSASDTIFVYIYDRESDTLSVSASITTSSGNTVSSAFSKNFTDDGLNGDHTGYDGVFTAILNSTALQQQQTSEFNCSITPSERGKNSGETVHIKILQNPDNGHPPVISNLIIPDTVYISTETEFKISVSVADQEGLSDIASVTRVNVTLSGQPRPLNDDGLNGDAQAGDGIYTETVSVNPPPALGKYLFRVKALDKSGLESNSLEKEIVITN